MELINRYGTIKVPLTGKSSPPTPQDVMVRAENRITARAKGLFQYGESILVPEIIQVENVDIQPMIYINETGYDVPTDQLTQIPDLLIYEDRDLVDWTVERGKLKEKTKLTDALWIFPGGGGKYMREMLGARDIFPQNILEIDAKRYWTSRGEVYCKVNLPLGDEDIKRKLKQAKRAIFTDDTICTGSTLAETLKELSFYYGWEPQFIDVCVQALAIPRKGEMFLWKIAQERITWDITSALFYGGKVKRPRLLSTGSIVRGIDDPERFSAKNYPPELIERVMQVVRPST